MDIINLLKKLFGTAAGRLAGLGLSLSVLVSIIKLTPQQWTANLGAWAQLIRGINTNIIWSIFVLVLLYSFYYLYKDNQQAQSNVTAPKELNGKSQNLATADIISYTKDEFGVILRKLIEEEDVDEIRVFAYTAETLRDYIAYSDRYRHLTIKIIVRDWTIERREEEFCNSERERRDPGIRPWMKWKKMRRLAKEFQDEMESDLTYKIQVRFYRSAPIFKGVIVSNSKLGNMEAFFGLYHWVERPEKGGSIYKGEGASVIHLQSNRGSHEKIFLERIISHFDRIWLTECRTLEDVFAVDNYSDQVAYREID